MRASTNFGPLIVERKTGATLWYVMSWAAAALTGGAGALALNASVPNIPLVETLFALTGVLILLPLLLPGRVLSFHERGLTERLPTKDLYALAYEDVEHMKWREVSLRSATGTDSIVPWSLVGVVVEGELVAAGRTLRFGFRLDTGGRTHQKVEETRDRIACYVAARARRQILANEPFPWGPARGARVSLRREGITYRPVGFLGAGDEQLVLWNTPLDFVIRRGKLAVLPRGGKDAIFAIACESPDFFPGFLVFTSMGQVRRL